MSWTNHVGAILRNGSAYVIGKSGGERLAGNVGIALRIHRHSYTIVLRIAAEESCEFHCRIHYQGTPPVVLRQAEGGLPVVRDLVASGDFHFVAADLLRFPG